MAEWKQKQTYALFAFVFLGSALAIFFDFVFNSYYYPDVWGFAALAALVAIFIFCVAWLVRSYQKANAKRKDQAASPAPRMLRRLRWTLLGGLPAAVAVSYSDGFMLGVHTRAALGFYILQIFWVIAYIRSAREKPFIFDGLIQTAMVPITMVCIDCILGSERFRPGDVAIFFMIFLAPWAMAVLLPRRLTLIIHSSLLAIILLRMFAAIPLGEIWISVLCNFLGAIVCWGCCSDAATDAPAADRLPEFAIFTQAGFVVFGIAFAMLPSVVLEHVVRLPIPLFLPHRANEYAFVLAVTASLVVRSIPWDRMTKTANGAKSEPEA